MRLNETEMVKLLPAWMQEDGSDKGIATGCDIISRDAYARLKLLTAMRRDELHGVVAVGQHHAAQVHRILLDKLNRAASSLLTGGVASNI